MHTAVRWSHAAEVLRPVPRKQKPWRTRRDLNLRRFGGVSETPSGERESPAEIPKRSEGSKTSLADPERLELEAHWRRERDA